MQSSRQPAGSLARATLAATTLLGHMGPVTLCRNVTYIVGMTAGTALPSQAQYQHQHQSVTSAAQLPQFWSSGWMHCPSQHRYCWQHGGSGHSAAIEAPVGTSHWQSV